MSASARRAGEATSRTSSVEGESTPSSRLDPTVSWAQPTISLAPTGETVAQIRDRVLPIGATINGVTVVDDGTRVPLYTDTPGFVVVNLRSGLAITRQSERHARADQCVRPQLPCPRLRRGRARPRRVCKPLGVVLIAASAVYRWIDAPSFALGVVSASRSPNTNCMPLKKKSERFGDAKNAGV